MEFLQGLIDSQVDLIFSKTKDGRFFICNQSFADHRGTTKEAIVGKNDYDFSPKELADGYIERDNTVMNGRDSIITREEAINRLGKKIVLETRKAPFYNRAGELIGMCAIARDITEVVKREELLERQNEEIRRIKDKQDADYFLLSLLFKPLMLNQTVGDKVKLDFYVEQKTQLVYRNENVSLGGDICIGHSIKLSGRPCTFFVAADAMGKSVQGAGGAIILGAIFNHFAQTAFRDAIHVSPENFLKDIYVRLQNVFLPFEGVMLMAGIIGIVDDDTRKLFYFNAEYPLPALLRSGGAAFISDKKPLPLIGTGEATENIPVEIFQLNPGDVLIAGSDGKDDLIPDDAKDAEHPSRLDERRFLDIIERSNGELTKIVTEIKKIGKLTDDLSLLSISVV